MAESRYLAGVPNPRAKQRRKTLVLWIILVVLFLAIWQFLTPPPERAGHRRRAPVEEEEPFSPLTNAAFAFGAFTVVAGVLFLTMRKRLFPPPAPLLDAELSLLHEDYDAAIEKTRAFLRGN